MLHLLSAASQLAYSTAAILNPSSAFYEIALKEGLLQAGSRRRVRHTRHSMA